MSVKFIALSGTTAVTENLYVYETDKDMMIVDCGVGFPDSEMFGVDLVIPDFSYIRKNQHKLKGILISHGHEDHIGALPFLLKDVNVPVYSTKLVSAFIKDKLTESGVKNAKLYQFDPDKETVKIGDFIVTPFRVPHSMPDAVGYAIDTPEGRLFHVAEYKFEKEPIDGFLFDEEKARKLATEKPVLSLASDCLGSYKEGFVPSEQTVIPTIEKIMKKAKKAIFFTTISSSISRMQIAINIAKSLGRKTVYVGRSIDKKATAAHELGFLKYDDSQVLDSRSAKDIDPQELMYIIAGSYGQPGSALYRLAHGEHQHLTLEEGDTVVFSSDPAPPGSKEAVDYVVDKLTERNADVYFYEKTHGLHVSGHGMQEDIKKLISIVKPEYFIPTGGTVRHMRGFRDLLVTQGIEKNRVFELLNGDVVEFSGGQAKKAGKVEAKEILVDGTGVGDVGRRVLADRAVLQKDGVVVVLIQVDKRQRRLMCDPDIISRGFVFQKESKDLMDTARKGLVDQTTKLKTFHRNVLKDMVTAYLEKLFEKETGRHPMILPVVVEV